MRWKQHRRRSFWQRLKFKGKMSYRIVKLLTKRCEKAERLLEIEKHCVVKLELLEQALQNKLENEKKAEKLQYTARKTARYWKSC